MRLAHLLPLAVACLAACAAQLARAELSPDQQCALRLQPLVTTRGACSFSPGTEPCPPACTTALEGLQATEGCLAALGVDSTSAQSRA